MTNPIRFSRLILVASAFFRRLSKHAALLVCLLILGTASGRYRGSQVSIFALAVVSVALNFGGRALRQTPGCHDRRNTQADKIVLDLKGSFPEALDQLFQRSSFASRKADLGSSLTTDDAQRYNLLDTKIAIPLRRLVRRLKSRHRAGCSFPSLRSSLRQVQLRGIAPTRVRGTPQLTTTTQQHPGFSGDLTRSGWHGDCSCK
jgi:hypothetical protein